MRRAARVGQGLLCRSGKRAFTVAHTNRLTGGGGAAACADDEELASFLAARFSAETPPRGGSARYCRAVEKTLREGLERGVAAALSARAALRATSRLYCRSATEQLAKEYVHSGGSLDASMYISLMNAPSREGDVAEVHRLIQECLAAVEGFAMNEVMYFMLVRSLANGGHVETALNVLEKMRKEADIRPETMTVAVVLAKCTEKSQLESLQLQAYLRGAEGREASALYGGAIQAYARMHDRRGAERVLSEAQQRRVTVGVREWQDLMRAYGTDLTGVRRAWHRLMRHGVETPWMPALSGVTYDVYLTALATHAATRDCDAVRWAEEAFNHALGQPRTVDRSALVWGRLMLIYSKVGDMEKLTLLWKMCPLDTRLQLRGDVKNIVNFRKPEMRRVLDAYRLAKRTRTA